MKYLILILAVLLCNVSCAQTSKTPKYAAIKGLTKDQSTFVHNILRNEQPLAYTAINTINGIVLTMSFEDKCIIMILDDNFVVDMIEKNGKGKLIVYGGESD